MNEVNPMPSPITMGGIESPPEPYIIHLPPEILGQILADSCTMRDNELTEMKGTRAMILATVSREWREVARCTPELWAKFRLQVDPAGHPSLERILRLLTFHLERSQHFPLSFIIAPDGPSSRLEVFFDALFEHAHHWGDVTFGHGVFPDSLLPLATVEAFPHLRTLKATDIISRPVDAFLRAPNLRYLHFTRSCVTPPVMPMPWSNIVSLSLWRGSTNIESIFYHCSQLQHLDLRGTNFSMKSFPSDRICTSQLRSLYLEMEWYMVSKLKGLLNYLSLPNAVRVCIVCEGADIPVPHPELISFLARCKMLKDLEIRRFCITRDQLFEYPLTVPSLVRLKAAFEHQVGTAEFALAVDLLFARCPQLNDVRVLGLDEDIEAEYQATRCEDDKIVTSLTYIGPSLLF